MGNPQLICRDSEIKRIGMWGLGSLQLICSDSEIKRVGIWGMGSPQLICRDSEIKRIGMWGLGSLQLICSDSEIKRVGIWGLGVFPNIHFIEERFSMMFCNFAMNYMKITLFLRGHSLTHSLNPVRVSWTATVREGHGGKKTRISN